MYLLRHGQSEFNVHFSRTRIDPGIEDPNLTSLGRAQAALAAEKLVELGVRQVISSPYRRAIQTAEIVADVLGSDITIDETVRERCWFICDIGSPASVLKAQWPAIDFGDLAETWWPADGEDEAGLQQRVARFRSVLAETDRWGDTVYVSHWAFIRGLTDLTVDNGTIVRLGPQDLKASVVHAPEA